MTDDFSPFAAEDEFEPQRRSPAKTILLLALLVIVAAAAFWFFAPRPQGQARHRRGRRTPLQIVTTTWTASTLRAATIC